MDLSFAEHLVETLQRFGGLGEHAEAADRPVEPVGEAQEDLAGFFVAPGDEGLVGIGQAFVARLVALRDLARALVHHQQVVVLVEDAPRQVVELLFCQLPVLHIAKIVFFREGQFVSKKPLAKVLMIPSAARQDWRVTNVKF